MKGGAESADTVADDEMIFDIGSEIGCRAGRDHQQGGTIVWNGPVGVFEFDQFGEGTKTVSMAIANAAGFSLAGGGDTIALRSRSTTSMTRCRTSRPLAALSSNTSKARRCRRWRCSRSRQG